MTAPPPKREAKASLQSNALLWPSAGEKTPLPCSIILSGTRGQKVTWLTRKLCLRLGKKPVGPGNRYCASIFHQKCARWQHHFGGDFMVSKPVSAWRKDWAHKMASTRNQIQKKIAQHDEKPVCSEAGTGTLSNWMLLSRECPDWPHQTASLLAAPLLRGSAATSRSDPWPLSRRQAPPRCWNFFLTWTSGFSNNVTQGK